MRKRSLDNTGLPGVAIAAIRRIVYSNSRVEEAIVFGSRARGSFRPFSDVDICLKGSRLTHDDMVEIIGMLEESQLPYEFDICRYNSLFDSDLRRNIDASGILL